jgi:hypothetical protein
MASIPAAGCDEECREELQGARDATEKYWVWTNAIVDGFVELPGCRSSDGGATGVEYVSLERSLDQRLDVEQPESLLYMPEGLGGAEREGAGRRLAAIVYRVPVLDDTQKPPELFGHTFNGPAPGIVPGLREFRLRVWLFSPNPVGLFADANPADTCLGAGLVAPHPFQEGLFEVGAQFSVDAATVREVLGVPPELRLQGENPDGSGDAQLVVSAQSFQWSNGDPATTPTFAAGSWVNLQPPDWPGDNAFPVNGYLFSILSDNDELVGWMQRGMGVGSEVIAHSADIALDFVPGALFTSPYRFTSPTFVLKGLVTDDVSANTTFSWRMWHEGAQGMGLFRGWHDDAQLGGANITVTPAPGTPLAEILGCDPDADSCDPVRADAGAVVVAERPSPWMTDVLHEWWNPRLGEDG